MPARVVATWSFGTRACDAAMARLRSGGSALDAVVDGATLIERDPSVDSVGVGGRPDASGRVSLDACVMEDPDRCGSVACLREHVDGAAIARRVMERTIHVMLVGPDADDFARQQGFTSTDLLTLEARHAWETWRDRPGALDRARYRGWIPPANVEERGGGRGTARPLPGHDTIGLLALDGGGRLAGACTTSGMAFKVPGRVGDSPIIGHGLYVDQQAGAAAATGTGELVMGVCGSFLCVELMRQGREPLDAVRAVLERIADRYRLHEDHQVAIIAMTPDGRWGAGALRPGFVAAVADEAPGRAVEPGVVLMAEAGQA